MARVSTDDPMLEVSVFCLECGEPAIGSPIGWRAFLGGGFDGDPVEVGVYCPACSSREFGNEEFGLAPSADARQTRPAGLRFGLPRIQT